MASYHCTVKAGAKGKAAAHANYISREGQYANANRYEDLIASDYGNMPAWAAHNPSHLWQASDAFERANGTAYREIEVALPRELTEDQQRDLVSTFVALEFDDQHAYQWAIHCPKAALEKGDQPHAHIMYCERIQDGIARDPAQYFKRYNRKAPERGGCQKMPGGTPAERKAQLVALRERWATLQNRHLNRYGHAARVDHRRLDAQGVARDAEQHLGGRGVRQLSETDRAALLERRAAERAVETAQNAVNVIDLAPALAAAQKAKAAADKVATAAAEKTRIQRMTLDELNAEIDRLTPPAVDQLIERHPDLQAARGVHDQLTADIDRLEQTYYRAGRDATQWRASHPLRTKLHDRGIKRAAFLVEQQRRQTRSQHSLNDLKPQLQQASDTVRRVYERLLQRTLAAQAPAQAKIAALEQRIAEYQTINLDALIQRNGLALRYDGGIEAQLDHKRSLIRHITSPEIDTHRRYFGRSLVEKYAQWYTDQKRDLDPRDKPRYQKALTAELGARTGHLRMDDPPQDPDLVTQVRRDVDAMFKRLVESAPLPTRRRSAQRERGRDDRDFER